MRLRRVRNSAPLPAGGVRSGLTGADGGGWGRGWGEILPL